MKKTMLWGALLTLCCVQAQADEVTTPAPSSTTTPAPAATQSAPTTQPQTTQPTPTTQQTQPQQTQPTTPTPTPDNQQNSNVPQAPQPTTGATDTATLINCDYKIPAQTKTVDQNLVLKWSEKAAVQAFDFDPVNVDTQIQTLKACFTDQGWTSFNTALQKSGNLEAIKTQKLHVSSQLDGQPQMMDAKDNQWKVSLPLQVVYQNEKEKVTQLLDIQLNVTRKTTGDLGISQIIAAPRSTATQQQNTAPATTSTNPAPAVNNTTPATPAGSTNQ